MLDIIVYTNVSDNTKIKGENDVVRIFYYRKIIIEKHCNEKDARALRIKLAF